MTAPIQPTNDPRQPEDGAGRLARQRRVFAEIEARYADDPEKRDTLKKRFIERERIAPEQEMAPRTIPERVAQGATAIAAGVPGAKRAIAGYRALADEMMGRDGDVEGEMAQIKRDLEDLPTAARVSGEIVGGMAVPLGPLAGRAGTGALNVASRVGAKGGNALLSGAAAGADRADLEGGSVGAGATAGGLTALALQGLISGVGGAGRGAMSLVRSKSAKDAAMDKMLALAADEGAGDAGTGLQNILKETASRRAAGGDPMAMEVFGPRGLNTARATKNAPFSSAAKELPEAVAARSAGAFDRASEAVRKGANVGPEEPGFVLDRLTAYRTQRTRPLFQAAEAEAAQNGGLATGPAADYVMYQAERNPLMRQVVEGVRTDPKLVDAPPNSYEVLDAAYKRINDLIRDARLKNDLTQVGDLDKVRNPLLDALTELSPSYRNAAQAFAEESIPLNSFTAGFEFSDLSPYDLNKALSTGKLPSGYTVDPEAFKLGTAQRLIRDLERRASSPSMAGVATDKNPLLALNNRELDRQLKEVLGEGYDAMVPTFREIVREIKSAQQVMGGSNTTAQLADDPDFVTAGLSKMSGGIGFGKDAALRRFTMGGLAGTVRSLAETGAGKRAGETGRALTTRGNALDELVAELQKRLEAQGVTGAGSVTRGLRDMPDGVQGLPALLRLLSASSGGAAGKVPAYFEETGGGR